MGGWGDSAGGFTHGDFYFADGFGSLDGLLTQRGDVDADVDDEAVHAVADSVGGLMDGGLDPGEELLVVREVEFGIGAEGGEVAEGSPAGAGGGFDFGFDPFQGFFPAEGAAGGDPGDGAFAEHGPVGGIDPALEVVAGHLAVVDDEAGEVHGRRCRWRRGRGRVGTGV